MRPTATQLRAHAMATREASTSLNLVEWVAQFPDALPTPAPWPRFVCWLAKGRRDGDRGVGDVVARIVGPMGGDAFKWWYKRLVGRDCGCASRQDRLNQLYPFA